MTKAFSAVLMSAISILAAGCCAHEPHRHERPNAAAEAKPKFGLGRPTVQVKSATVPASGGSMVLTLELIGGGSGPYLLRNKNRPPPNGVTNNGPSDADITIYWPIRAGVDTNLKSITHMLSRDERGDLGNGEQLAVTLAGERPGIGSGVLVYFNMEIGESNSNWIPLTYAPYKFGSDLPTLDPGFHTGFMQVTER